MLDVWHMSALSDIHVYITSQNHNNFYENISSDIKFDLNKLSCLIS